MAEATFTDPSRMPQATQLRLWPLLVLVLVLVLGLGGAAIVYVRAKSRAPVAPPAADVGGWPSWMQQPPVYAAPKPSAPPPPQERATVTIPKMPGPPDGLPSPPGEPAETGARGTPATSPVRQTKQPSVPPPKQGDRPPVRKWLFAEMQDAKRKPFAKRSGQSSRPDGRAPGPEGAPAQDDPEGPGQAGTLITPARWEVPADRTKVLYPSHVIHAQLLTDLVSTIPSEVRLILTEDVQDKFFQGTVLLPQYTIVTARQTATPKYGQDRLEIGLQLAELPGGSVIDFTQGVAGDGQGGGGLPGKVNNHYGTLILATLMSTALSVGSRVVVQDRGTFRPSVEEEIAAEVSRGVNNAGQQIIRRELDRPPTITVPHGSAVTLQLKAPLSLMSAPRIVER